MLKQITKRILLALPMLIVVSLIFSFSAADGQQSGSLSLAIAEWVSDVLDVIGINVSASVLHLPIRKFAHMSEYALLAITAMWAFYGMNKRYIIAFVVSVLFAVSDELHQLYVPDRAGTFVDVFIDAAGMCIGLIFYKVISRVRVIKSEKCELK